MLPLKPKYRLGHKEKYLFPSAKTSIVGSQHPKKSYFNFEKNSTGERVLRVNQRILSGQCESRVAFGTSEGLLAEILARSTGKLLLLFINIVIKTSPHTGRVFCRSSNGYFLDSARAAVSRGGGAFRWGGGGGTAVCSW